MLSYLTIQDVLYKKYINKKIKIEYPFKFTSQYSPESFIDSGISPFQFIGPTKLMLLIFGKKFFNKLQCFEENLLYLNLN